MTDSSMAFACFMARPAGRALRIVAGLALIGWGYTMRATTPGTVLMVVGVVPLMAGVLNLCLLAPILGAPFSGTAALASERSPSGRR